MSYKHNENGDAVQPVRTPKKTPKNFPPGLVFAVLLLFCVVVAFVTLAVSVSLGWTQGFDVRVLLRVDAALPEWLYGSMVFFTAIGYYRVCGALVVVAAGVFLWIGWRASAIVVCASTFGGMLATNVLKTVFGRERPDFIDSGYTAGYLAFPSGHATMAVGFYVVLTVILFLHLRGAVGWSVLVFGLIVAALIGLSRLYLGVHYPSDILAGYLVSPTILAADFVLYVVAKRRTKAEKTSLE